jgi:hypothetical protein
MNAIMSKLSKLCGDRTLCSITIILLGVLPGCGQSLSASVPQTPATYELPYWSCDDLLIEENGVSEWVITNAETAEISAISTDTIVGVEQRDQILSQYVEEFRESVTITADYASMKFYFGEASSPDYLTLSFSIFLINNSNNEILVYMPNRLDRFLTLEFASDVGDPIEWPIRENSSVRFERTINDFLVLSPQVPIEITAEFVIRDMDMHYQGDYWGIEPGTNIATLSYRSSAFTLDQGLNTSTPNSFSSIGERMDWIDSHTVYLDLHAWVGEITSNPIMIYIPTLAEIESCFASDN